MTATFNTSIKVDETWSFFFASVLHWLHGVRVGDSDKNRRLKVARLKSLG